MTWRVARSLETLLEQINEIAPDRSKISDGSIGDTSHQNRTSDHNPWCGPGVVTARDFTHDPDSGADMGEIAEALRASRDPRIKYVIYSGRMFSSYATSSTPAWTWRPYSGINAHKSHMHVSVQCGLGRDDRSPWKLIDRKDWFAMATEAQLRKIVREEVKKIVKEERKILAVGTDQDTYDPNKVNLKQVLTAQARRPL